MDYTYERFADRQVFKFKLYDSPARISIRLGPLSPNNVTTAAFFNGNSVDFSEEFSGDSRWVWVRGIDEREGTVEIIICLG